MEILQLVPDDKPSRERVTNSFAWQMVLGKLPSKQLPEAAKVEMFGIRKKEGEREPVSAFPLISRVCKYVMLAGEENEKEVKLLLERMSVFKDVSLERELGTDPTNLLLLRRRKFKFVSIPKEVGIDPVSEFD